MYNRLLLESFCEDEGIEARYDKLSEEVVFRAFYNYMESTEEFRVPIDELLKMFEVPMSVIRRVYGESAFYIVKKQGGPRKRANPKLKKFKRKWYREEDMFKYNKIKPMIDLICKFKGCGKTFTVTINEKNRKYCSSDCVKAAFAEGVASGEFQEKAKVNSARRKIINAKIKETKRKNKEERLRKEKEQDELRKLSLPLDL